MQSFFKRLKGFLRKPSPAKEPEKPDVMHLRVTDQRPSTAFADVTLSDGSEKWAMMVGEHPYVIVSESYRRVEHGNLLIVLQAAPILYIPFPDGPFVPMLPLL